MSTTQTKNLVSGANCTFHSSLTSLQALALAQGSSKPTGLWQPLIDAGHKAGRLFLVSALHGLQKCNKKAVAHSPLGLITQLHRQFYVR
jgi:hypothetical protein